MNKCVIVVIHFDELVNQAYVILYLKKGELHTLWK